MPQPSVHINPRSSAWSLPSKPISALRANLHDSFCLCWLFLVVAAQSADIATTIVGLNTSGVVEMNPLLRPLLGQSFLLGFAVKLAAITLALAVAMVRLQGRRARCALALAALVSSSAVFLNLHTLLA